MGNKIAGGAPCCESPERKTFDSDGLGDSTGDEYGSQLLVAACRKGRQDHAERVLLELLESKPVTMAIGGMSPALVQAPTIVLVSKAGCDLVNGLYRREGDFKDKPAYIGESGQCKGVQLWFAAGEWRIGYTNDYYYTSGVQEDSPVGIDYHLATGHRNVEAVSPAPQVTLPNSVDSSEDELLLLTDRVAELEVKLAKYREQKEQSAKQSKQDPESKPLEEGGPDSAAGGVRPSDSATAAEDRSSKGTEGVATSSETPHRGPDGGAHWSMKANAAPEDDEEEKPQPAAKKKIQRKATGFVHGGKMDDDDDQAKGGCCARRS